MPETSPEPPVTCRPILNEAEQEAAFHVRTEVFVVEQGCPPEEELDEYDAVAQHFVALAGDEVIGTARVYSLGNGAAKVGRVAVLREWRGRGIGVALMEAVWEWAGKAGYRECVLHAQTYVIPFYKRLGYAAEGEIFYEANIPHRKMRRRFGEATEELQPGKGWWKF